MRVLILLAGILFFSSPVLAQLVSSASVSLVGVQEVNGAEVGSIADLLVEVHNGSGRVFVDTMPLTQIDTQTSARLASEVSCDLLELNCSSYDFFYVIRSDSPLIGGPSAGGAMALATLLALTKVPSLGSVAMTGTINPDGTIGPIGGVFAKAQAVYKAGFKTFLVPHAQSIIESLNGTINLTNYASTNWGLRVVEVSNLEDVFTQFTGSSIVRENLSSDVVTGVYNDLISVMSSALFDRFKSLESSVRSDLSSSNSSSAVISEVSSLLNESSGALVNVSKFFDDGRYYVAASRSLQESINLDYASLLMLYDASFSKPEFARSTLEVVNSSVYAFPVLNNYSRVLDNVHDLELIVASLDRLREAESIISAAFDSLSVGDYRNALYLAAVARERLFTAGVWLNTTNHLSGSENFVFDVSKLAGLASSSILEASTSVTYASTVVSPGLVSNLQADLDSVSSFVSDGKFARAIFESLSLKAEANLLMEVRGLDSVSLSSLFEIKRSNVVRLIAREEARGELPVLAISYLLYADYFFEVQDFSNAIRYLNYAAQYSSLSSQVFEAVTGSPHSSQGRGYSISGASFRGSNDYLMFLLGLLTASLLFLVVISFKRFRV